MKRKEIKKQLPRKGSVEKIIPDTSIIIEGILSEKIQELKPKKVMIHEAVMAELEAQANKGKEIGYQGLEEVKRIRELCEKNKILFEFTGSRPTDFEIKYAKSGEIDSLIRELAFKEKGTLMTADIVQSLVAESKGIQVIYIEFEKEERPIVLEKFFDEHTMSVHLKENCLPKAKKGRPGDWSMTEISNEKFTRETLRELSKEIIKEAKMREDGFVEIDRKGSTIIQLANYRIVIVRPPLADGYEITAVRPVKRLAFNDYKLSEKLRKRIEEQAEGILIAGAPGHGKSTFAQALAELYLAKHKIVKTVEAPRDLILDDNVTQYAISHGSSQEIHDILLLSRPDYTIFDEMRNTSDFALFADLRLSGVGMVGVIHATNPIDAIQRFIGRIELGVIPHVIDTVIFIKNGEIDKVFSLAMEVKVPSGMFEQDLARPVVVVNDFETGKLDFEIYSYGEQTVVIPVKAHAVSPTEELAAKHVEREFSHYSDMVKVDIVTPTKCIVYVPEEARARIIGKNGSNIEKIEKKLGLNIDVRDLNIEHDESQKQKITYDARFNKKNITFFLNHEYANMDVDIKVKDEYLLTVRSSKKAIVKLTKNNKIGKLIMDALNNNEKVELEAYEKY